MVSSIWIQKFRFSFNSTTKADALFQAAAQTQYLQQILALLTEQKGKKKTTLQNESTCACFNHEAKVKIYSVVYIVKNMQIQGKIIEGAFIPVVKAVRLHIVASGCPLLASDSSFLLTQTLTGSLLLCERYG